MTTFEELGVNKKVCKAIAEMGWTEPTPIQTYAVPEGLSGKDMFGQAQTGTGKTGAFTMIVLGRIRHGSDRPLAIVMTPTRELADQVSKDMISFSRFTKHRIVCLYGGASLPVQLSMLKEGCDVVVGTPGRILDLCRRGELKLDMVKELVIDEADRMLDMGFIDDMNEIIGLLPENRQTLLFSATVSDDVRKLLGTMRDPIEISVSGDEPASDLVTQYWIGVSRGGKREALREILANGDPKTVVFCSTKRMVDDLHTILNEKGVRSGAIHGDMPQARRNKTIRAFKEGRTNLLIATDVAARGLDIDDIECVVNYDAPLDAETYTHRIGRAGRAGRTGVAFTFITPSEDARIQEYECYTGRKIQFTSRRRIDDLEISNQELKGLHAEEREEARIARGALETKKEGNRADRRRERLESKTMVTIMVSIGTKDDMSRDNLRDFIKGSSGVPVSSIGKIGMGSKSSFIDVDPECAQTIIDALNATRFNNHKVKASFAPQKERYRDEL